MRLEWEIELVVEAHCDVVDMKKVGRVGKVRAEMTSSSDFRAIREEVFA